MIYTGKCIFNEKMLKNPCNLLFNSICETMPLNIEIPDFYTFHSFDEFERFFFWEQISNRINLNLNDPLTLFSAESWILPTDLKAC